MSKTRFTKRDMDRVLAVVAAAIAAGREKEAQAALAAGKSPEAVLAALKSGKVL